MSKFPELVLGVAVICALASGPVAAGVLGLGRAALPEEIAAWDKDISPDGTGLPDGSGSVEAGEEVFAENCANCHGDFAEGVDNWPELAGGAETLDHDDPVKTVGSFWPYLSTVFDYVRRSKPYGNAQTLSDDEVYSIVAFILYSNDLVSDDFVLSQENFLQIELPNAGGFIVDDRNTAEYELFAQDPCMSDCKDDVSITMRATVLDVTPGEPTGDGEAAAVSVSDPDPELVAAGKKVFRKCKACHQVGEGARNKTGPILTGVVGNPAGGQEKFRYSSALTRAASEGLIWTNATLAAFLSKPTTFLEGTKMSFAGLKKETDVIAVIAYLRFNEE